MPTWETSADWAAGQQQDGINRRDDATKLEKGYPGDWTLENIPTPTSLWPLEESSGTTIGDAVGSNDIGSVSATAGGRTGIFGNNAWDFDDDGTQNIEISTTSHSELTFLAWAELDDKTNNDDTLIGDWRAGNGSNSTFFTGRDDGNDGWRHTWMETDDDLYQTANINAPAPTGSLILFLGVWDGPNNEARFYIDGTLEDTTSTNGDDIYALSQFAIGHENADHSEHGFWDGPISAVAVWDGTALTTSQASTLYDAVVNTSDYWTSKKTEAGNQTDIQITTDSTIPASTSVTVTLFEDVGNDGTGSNTDSIGNSYDNSASVTLSGGADETNTLTGFDGGGSTNSYWAHIELTGDGSDPTVSSPSFNSLDAATSGIIWDTASDWDSAQSETGVHHEQPAGTDWSPSDIVEKGYPSSDEGGSSLVGYWPLDEDSGSTANDISGNSNDGTINGTASISGGVFGNTARSFDGTRTDYIDIPDDDTLDLTTFTISAWVYLDSLPESDWPGIVTKGGGSDSTGDNHNYALIADGGTFGVNGPMVLFETSDGSNSSAGDTYANAGISSGEWHHWCGTYDGSNLIMYVDGSEIGSTSTTDAPATQSLNVNFGRSHVSAASDDDKYPNMDLCEVRIYSRSLSSNSVTDLYNAPL